MSFLRAGALLGASTATRLAAALVAIKLIVLQTGAEGLGQIGFLMNVIAVLATISGGGILNGIIKRVAETKDNASELKPVIGTSVSVCIGWSIIVGGTLYIFAEPISYQIFRTDNRSEIFRWLAVGQIFMTCATLFNGYLSGHQDTSKYAILSAIGSLVGMLGIAFGVWFWGLTGAMFGLIWLNSSPGLVMLCWVCMTWTRKTLSVMKPSWTKQEARTLFKFSLMLSVSAMTLPLTQLYIQQLIQNQSSWTSVGYWQAAVRYTDTATQFLAVLLTNYYLPKLAQVKDKHHLYCVLKEAYTFVVPTLAAFALFSILLSEKIIILLYSKELVPARELFIWQVAGTTFKFLAYIIGYIAVARASTWLYILAEVFQAALFCLFGMLLVPEFGVLGASVAYVLTYLIYFIICSFALIFFYRSVEGR